MTDDEKIEMAHDQATELAISLLQQVGFIPDGCGGLIGNVSLAVAGGALGIAAGRVMAAVSDNSFEQWIHGLRLERSRTRCEILTEQ
jgi:hypothetical protein